MTNMHQIKCCLFATCFSFAVVLSCLLFTNGCITPDHPGSGASTRRVLAFSDMHAGNASATAGGVDGAEWLQRACAELKTNGIPVDYALVLGDITQNGLAEELESYIKVRDQSGISSWFELAGNHEYARDGRSVYQEQIRSTKPYGLVDGNIAWFFLSDEEPGVPGDVSVETLRWLDQKLTEHKGKIIIVCSHQLVYGTLSNSTRNTIFLNPKEQIDALLARHHVDLWLSGHEHHSPWTEAAIGQRDETWFINVASMSHAYNTGESQSFVLEFTEGEHQIKVRRRVHDKASFPEKGSIVIPLQRDIKLGTPVEERYVSPEAPTQPSSKP